MSANNLIEVKVMGRRLDLSHASRHIGYKSDNLVETRTFCIEDKSLFGFDFFIDLESTLESTLLEKSFSEDNNKMYLTWDISSGCLKKPGVITFQLRGVDSNGVKVWHSEKNYFLSGDCVDVYSGVTPEEANSFLKIEKNVLKLKKETQKLCDEASENLKETKQLVEEASALNEEAKELCEDVREEFGNLGENIYTKEEANARFSLIGHDHLPAYGYNKEGISSFEIEEISGNFKSFNNGVIEVSGKTLLGFLSLDYYTNVVAQFKLLSGTAKVYYGVEMTDFESGQTDITVESVTLNVNESTTITAKGSITSLVDLGGVTFSENCLIIIEAVDAKIAVEAYKKSVYSYGFMSGEDAEKLQNTYTKEEIDNKIGSIDTALDELHAYAQALIGGEA